MLKRNIVVGVTVTVLIIISVTALFFFLYPKKIVNTDESVSKNELEISPRAVLQPLNDSNTTDQREAAVLYGRVTSITGDTLSIAERTEDGIRAKSYTVKIDSTTPIMVSTFNKQEKTIVVSSKPLSGDSFELRVGSYVEIAYRKPPAGDEITAERIIYSD